MAKPAILIVDDSPANLKVARVALEADGYEVRTAADGEEAWRMLGSFRPSSILMDLQLPGLDGFQLTQRIKADPELAKIPIIAVTAYAMKGDRERAIAAGCDDYIAKPVDPTLLPALVATHLPDTSQRAAAARSQASQPILVIEDNPTTRKLIRVALESDGHEAFEAADARSALHWLEHYEPSLVIQDLMLPDMDGLELVRRLHELPHARNVPVVCLSGFLARMDDAKAMASSFSELLVKPVDPVQLLECVRRRLGMRRPAPPIAAAPSGPHVLLVDDDPLQRRLAEFQLVGAGFRVTSVASAKQALTDAEGLMPDVVISDVLMPEMDGFELCFTLRQHPKLKDVPVVLVSSHYTERGDQLLAQGVGASALIAREGDWSGVFPRVRQAIERQPAPPPKIGADAARDAILRRTLMQLDRQLLTNRRLEQRCMFQSAQLSVLARIADALRTRAQLDEALNDAISVCLDLAGISKGVLYVLRDGSLAPKHRFGFDASEADDVAHCFGHAPLLAEIVASGQVRAIPTPGVIGSQSHDIPGHRTELVFDDFLRRAGIRAALIVPIVVGEQTYGALVLGARTTEVTSDAAVSFARVLGAQLGQAIGLADTFEQLHASEHKFRALVDSMDDVTVVDRDQRVTGVYGQRLEREQIDRAAVLGKTLQEIIPHDRSAHDEAHARALAGESVLYDWSSGAEPSVRYFQAAVSPVRDAEGRVTSVVRVARDVTEQKQLQTQLMVSDRMASIGLLSAGVAHEINNPLMAVLGNLQLALETRASAHPADGAAPPEDLELLQDALTATQRVEAIVRDLRLFSRSEEDRTTAVDVHAVLDSTLRMAHNQLRHRARVVRDFGEIPAVHGNASRLGQVFLNLLLNAAQAIADGHAEVNEIRVSTRLDTQGRVIVEIADTGPGIPAELRARLFTPFVTTKAAGAGTGLGLAICQRIVTALGGVISFDDRPGRGTVFRVQLLADRKPATDAPPPEAVPPVRRRGNVLIIDDDVALCHVLRKLLIHDHDVVASTDAREALQLLGSGARFDVILCDVMMPHMTGAEFHEHLQRFHPELVPRTLFLTGGAFTPSAHQFIERMRQRCLDKPLDIGALRKFINDYVK